MGNLRKFRKIYVMRDEFSGDNAPWWTRYSALDLKGSNVRPGVPVQGRMMSRVSTSHFPEGRDLLCEFGVGEDCYLLRQVKSMQCLLEAERMETRFVLF